ncbi:ATP-grasp fold amidoligase family protein [Robiginitalea sp. IMCC44478]|uniref:ATP-grasp fold amidoligase family protein n=1 Tax=Robiginitalea sp. IMCC44478 TaxID=3459122 RepID=UPI00404318F9
MKRLLLGLLKKFKFLPPELYVKIYYQYYTGKKLNLANPGEFNEKIQWLKVHYKPPILNQLVDKYAVRSFVSDRIGETYLNELYQVYYRAGDVDFDQLPEKFVIKGAHGYNFNLIVKDKSKLNKHRARYLMRKWMARNQYYRGGLEWAYKDVKPKLIAEAFLSELGRSTISDYKFYCFDGKVKFLQLDLERENDHQKLFYDPDWKKLPFTKGSGGLSAETADKPPKFEQMIALAEKLAKGFPFVRVDFYNLQGRIVFGEMTFYPGDGRQEFKPDSYNKIIGSYLNLPPLNGQKAITSYGPDL